MAAEVTVAAFAQEWLRRERLRLRPRSSETYEQVLTQHLLPTLGALALTDVTRDTVRTLLLSKLDAGYASGTVGLWLAVLSTLFNRALEEGLLKASPCVRLGKFLPRRKGAHAYRAISAVELARYFEVLGPHPLKPLFVVGIRTGLRIGELLGLRWSDVDLGRRQITVRQSRDDRGRIGPPKGGRVAVLPLSRDAQEALQTLPAATEGDHWVFIHDATGQPWSRCQVRRVMRDTCKKAGIPHAWPHLLRHTYITNLVEQGASAWEAQALARHASVAVTQTYVHAGLSDRHVSLVNALDRR